MAQEKMIAVTLKRSGIGKPQKQRATLQGLGLKKLHSRVVLKDTPEIRGMLAKVMHLIEVEKA